MEINEIVLTAAAILPAIVLGVYVFKKDRAEKEPIGLLLTLLLFGALICFPAAKLEGFIIDIIDNAFIPYAVLEDGNYVLSGDTFKIYNAVKYFIGVALVEEALKWIVMLFFTRKNKNFNSLFDGIVYAVFVS